MIPPSVVLAIYGIITEQDIGKLFIAGILPGLLATGMYIGTINVMAFTNPDRFPAAPRMSWTERWRALRSVWAILLLFVFVIGGIYGGVFTPTEAAGMGAGGAFLISAARGRLGFAQTVECLVSTVRTSASVFTILIGALIFGYFLTITQTPQKLTDFITHLGLGPYQVLVLVMLMYLALGCILDAMAMIILTIPIIFPAMMQLGFDPIWFGVIIVMTVELGLITPPVGMNVYVINSVVRNVSLATIFLGVLPFVVTDLVRLAILIAFPILSTFLPSQM
jgi:tripartite ATP-independent transporter DctM subunit